MIIKVIISEPHVINIRIAPAYVIAEVILPLTGRHRKNTLWQKRFKRSLQGAHGMTITILTVTGIRTDDPPDPRS